MFNASQILQDAINMTDDTYVNQIQERARRQLSGADLDVSWETPSTDPELVEQLNILSEKINRYSSAE